MDGIKFFRVSEADKTGAVVGGTSPKLVGIDGNGRIVSENSIGWDDMNSSDSSLIRPHRPDQRNMSLEIRKDNRSAVAVVQGDVDAKVAASAMAWYANEYVASIVIVLGLVLQLGLISYFVEGFFAWINDRTFNTTSTWFDFACYFAIFAQLMTTTFVIIASAVSTLFYTWELDVDYSNSILMPEYSNVAGVLKWLVRCNVKAFRYTFQFLVFAALTTMFIVYLSAVINKPMRLSAVGESSILEPYLKYMSETWGGLPSVFSFSAIPINAPSSSTYAGLAGVPPTAPIGTVPTASAAAAGYARYPPARPGPVMM